MDLDQLIEYEPGSTAPASESSRPKSSASSSSISSSSRQSSSTSSSTRNRCQSPSEEKKRKKKRVEPEELIEAIINRPQPQMDGISKFLLGHGATMSKFKATRLAKLKFDISNLVGKADIEHAMEEENKYQYVVLDESDQNINCEAIELI